MRRVAGLAVAMVLMGAGLAVAPAATVQAAPAAKGKPTPQLLDDAVARGEIDRATADEHLAEVFAGRGRSGRVPARFQSDTPWDGSMPLLRLRQRLSAQPASPTLARTEAALATATTCSSSTASLPNETISTHFYVTYGTVGGGLSISSYITSLETTYGTEVTSYGWAAPPAIPQPAPVGSKYLVRVDTLTGGLYGYVSTSGTSAGFVGDNPNTPWNDQDALASCMVLNQDFSGFPTAPQGSLDATTAHEFNHSIQFGYGAGSGSNTPDDTFFEGGATWMEDEVYDNANDNYNYLWPNFRDSLGDYDQLNAGSSYPYPMWIVFRGLTERFGTGVSGGGEDVMQDFWENTSKGIGNNLSALDIALQNKKGVTLADAYHDFAIGAGFMRTCGGGYALPYCFKEAAGYIAKAGLPPVAGSIPSVGASFSSTIEDDMSLAWVTLPTSGTYSLTLSNTDVGGQLRATAVCDTGTSLVRAPFPAVATAGTSTSLSGFSGGAGCVRNLAVITNQQQSPGNPSASPSRSFTLSTGVAGPNVPPVANADSYSTFEGTPLTIAAPGVLANDTDANGNLLTATLPTGQVGGTVSLAANGSFTFTPTAGFTGAGGFSYTANDGNGGTASATVTIAVGPRPTYVPLSPARLMDTRVGGTTIDGSFAATGPLAPGSSRILTVTGRGGVPTTPVGAVALNITAVAPSAGFLTVYPFGESRPLASNLNFGPSQTIPNLVIAKVGAGGQISIYNDTGSTNVLVDVAGWFPTGGGYTPLSPARLMDSRPGGTTIDGAFQAAGAIGPATTRSLQVTGRGGVPASGVSAVVLNVTAVGPSAGGFLTVFPTGESRPLASNLNFGPGATIPNLVIAKVGSGGQISIYNDTGATNVIADVAGWFPTGGGYTALSPARLMDSRSGGSTVDGAFQGTGAISPGGQRTLTVTGRGGVPPSGVGAVVLNITAVAPTAGGFLTVYPTGEARPLASNLNFAPGQTIPNLVIAKVGSGGQITIYNDAGFTNVIADVAGWLPTVS